MQNVALEQENEGKLMQRDPLFSVFPQSVLTSKLAPNLISLKIFGFKRLVKQATSFCKIQGKQLFLPQTRKEILH